MATTAEKVGIGTPLSRVDGPVKVTGTARYAAEHPIEGLVYGVAVPSAIAKGEIASIDETAARAVPGVVEILTHANRPHIAWFDRSYRDQVAPPGSPFRAFYDTEVQFSGQPVALVLAETFEAARAAAALLKIEYRQQAFNTDFERSLDERTMPHKKRETYTPPKPRGDAEEAFAAAPRKVEGRWHLATEHHNPMEMHATTVEWHGEGKLTIHDKTQGAQNAQAYVTSVFGLKAKDVRVLNPYVGGAFGSGLRPQYQLYCAVMAATMLERSVRVVMTRQQMFTHVHRPEAVQDIKLGADEGGRLSAIVNEATTSTSRFENNMENVVEWGLTVYACPNATGDYTIAPRDTYTSGDMRAPGAATGMTLFEMAMDEMAEQAGIDPLQFRLTNYTDVDPMHGIPYTSKALRQAYLAAAEAFGWKDRTLEPRSMRDGRELVGWGMATGAWEAMFQKTSARARLSANGHLEVANATTDIGTGTYTMMAVVAADTLGINPADITVKLGDTDLPAAPIEGGSWTAASTGTAVQLACRSLAKQLLKGAHKIEGDPLGSASIDEVEFLGGRIHLRSDPARAVALADAMRAAGVSTMEAEETAGPSLADTAGQWRKARYTHSAVFAEVKVDEELGVVRVTRIVNAVAAGRILSPKTARSQVLGGVVMGIGMALHEESMMDATLGRWMNHNLAEYHVPAHADVEDVEVIFVPEEDREVSPMGVKGVGEIGVVATAAAVANAIWHATGRRHRSLPITIDKVLGLG